MKETIYRMAKIARIARIIRISGILILLLSLLYGCFVLNYILGTMFLGLVIFIIGILIVNYTEW